MQNPPNYNTKRTRMYSNQVQNSISRGHPSPTYTRKEFYLWLEQNGYAGIFQTWMDSDFIKTLAPSVDRINPLKPYTIDNIQLMTWIENSYKANEEHHLVAKPTKESVTQFTLSGEKVAVYDSMTEAANAVNRSIAAVNQCVRGKQATCAGFKWEYTKS